jgi:hypothetical protein
MGRGRGRLASCGSLSATSTRRFLVPIIGYAKRSHQKLPFSSEAFNPYQLTRIQQAWISQKDLARRLKTSQHQPFCGAVLSGEFTHNALHQLESRGFGVLHIPYDSILATFRELGIDASSEDGVGGTTEEQFREKITKWESLPQPQATTRLLAKLHALHQREIVDFKQRLEAAFTRQVALIRLSVLRGHSVQCPDVESAIAYLIEEEKTYRLREDGEHREAFEVQVRFNTGARIEATFPKRAEAIAFLRGFA